MLATLLVLNIIFPLIADGRSALSNHHASYDVKHFELELDPTVGYWSPSTSSIDWCERNYAVTFYLAEFWNCLSSFSMCLVAGILLIRGFYYQLETRFLLLCLSFGIVGLGSVYFHGTLTHWGQMADELPMVYSMIVWWYILFRMDHWPRKTSFWNRSILIGLVYALFWTCIHNLKTFVLIFQGHFTLMVFGGIVRLIYMYRQTPYHRPEIFYLVLSYAGLLVPASIFWILDQQFCSSMNGENGFNPQFHAWWHLLCALDCHVAVVSAEALRSLTIKPNERLRFVFYCGFPFVDYSRNKSKNQKKD
jgi:dihydroceramidase